MVQPHEALFDGFPEATMPPGVGLNNIRYVVKFV